jgi:hypothetical protein
MEEDPNELVFYASTENSLAELQSSLAGMALGLDAIFSRKPVSFRPDRIVWRSYTLILLCGMVAAWQLLLLVFSLTLRRPVLVINKDGIFLTAVGVWQWFIRWEQIGLIKVYSYHGEARLGVVPKDTDAFFANQGRFVRKGVKAGLELGRAPLNIGQTVVPIPIAELASQIEHRFSFPVRRESSQPEPTDALNPSPADLKLEPTIPPSPGE